MMMISTGSALFLALFVASLDTLTSGAGFRNDDTEIRYVGRDRHYHCSRLGQDCKNGGICDEDGLCYCYEDSTNWNHRFTGYDCTVNITDFPNDDYVWEGCPCENVDFCHRREDGETLFCICPPDFFWDDCSKNRVTLKCESHSMFVYFNPIEPFLGKAYIGDNSSDESCELYNIDDYLSPYPDYDRDTYTLARWLDYDGGNCNQTLSNQTFEGNTTSSYMYHLTIQYDPVIQSDLDLIIDVTCHHLENGTWSTEYSFGAPRGRVDKGKEIQSSYFPVRNVFLNQEGRLITNTVYLGESVTMVHYLTNDESYTSLFVESCTFSDSVGDKKVTVIEDGCPNERSNPLGFSEAYWYDAGIFGVGFDLRVFRLGSDPVVKVSCRVRLCKRDEGSNCDMTSCNNNNRDTREAGDEFARSRRKRQTRGDEGTTSNTFIVLDPFDKNEQAFQVTADKCMSEPVIKSVGISLVVVITVLLVVSIVLALCVCRMTIARRERALKLRYRKDNPTTSFSNNGFEGGISDDSKYKGT